MAHRGALVISGTADQLVARRPHDNPHVGARDAVPHVEIRHQTRPAKTRSPSRATPLEPAPVSNLDAAVLRVQGKQALVGLGWKPAIAEPAVASALAALGPAVRLDQLIAEALRCCQRPSSLVQHRANGGANGSAAETTARAAGRRG